MTDFVKKVDSIVPLYTEPAAQDARAPYATYTLSEIPIRTKDGIAGYEGTISLSIYAESLVAVNALVAKVIDAIDGREFDGRKIYVADSDSTDYPDIGISGKTITINTLR